MPINNKYINREISWLSFNERVLQEAMDKRVPLFQRIRFLGIFSNNLDEFFRVRVATVRRIIRYKKKENITIGYQHPQEIMSYIQDIVVRQQRRFERIYRVLIRELTQHNIFVIDETQLTEEQKDFVRQFYQNKIKPVLVPIMIQHTDRFPALRDKTIYFTIKFWKTLSPGEPDYALIDLNTDLLPRFIELPSKDNKKHIIILDDVVRFMLKDIFSIFDFDHIEAFTIKITRDAELDMDDDISKSFVEKMEKSLERRKKGDAVRFVYDSRMPKDLFDFLEKRMRLHKRDSIIPGGRYHNFKDFINFPKSHIPGLEYENIVQIPVPEFDESRSKLAVIRKKDVVLHYPYQSFGYFIDVLREASIDPAVESVQITLYRVASKSKVINSLINAARNGKKVTVVMELQARFDEQANIYWSNKLQEENIQVIHGVPGLKVHSKIALITKIEGNMPVRYAYIGTGNFQEKTARIYCDDAILTSHPQITSEVSQIFDFFRKNYIRFNFNHLIVSPFSTRSFFANKIRQEIEHVKNGKEGRIIIKLNNLVDNEMIDMLYDAGKKGVKIHLIIRGICSLKAGIPGLSENIMAISIVDKFLEHSRIIYFANDGEHDMYISSADWMVRNLDNRIEVTAPVYDKDIKEELMEMLEIQLRDNSKARILGDTQCNRYIRNSNEEVRSQINYYDYLNDIYVKKTSGEKPDEISSQQVENENINL